MITFYRLIVCTVYVPLKNRREGKQERKGRKTHGPHTSYSRTTTTTNKLKSDSTQVTLTYILIYLSLNQYTGRKLATTRYVAVSNSAFYFC